MPRILIATPLYPPEVGGPATYIKLLEEELPRQGFEIEVVKFSNVRHLPKGVSHLAYFWRVLKSGWSADLILALDPMSVGLPSLLAAKILGKRFFLKIVGDFAWEQYQNKYKVSGIKYQGKATKFINLEEFQKNKYDWRTELRRKAQKFVARQAEKAIVPSQYLAKIILGWGVKPEKIKVIYNAFQPSVVEGEKEELKSFLNLTGPILVSAGRLVPWKGFEALIEIMPTLIRQFPDLKLFICGDGPDRRNLELGIKNYGLEEKVKLLGRVSQRQLLALITAADLFVLNTGYEGFSHQLLEVMSTATPIITTAVGGNPELIEDGREGIFVPYNGREALTVAITALLKKKKQAQILGWNAKHKIRQFSKEKMIKKLIEELR